VGALLDDAPLSHDQDAVRAAHGREAVGDDYARASGEELVEGYLYPGFGGEVYTARRLVEDE
jgi:hypothetical protein